MLALSFRNAPELISFLSEGNRAWEIAGGQKWVCWTSLHICLWVLWGALPDLLQAVWWEKMPSCHLHQLREVLVSSHPFTIPNDRQKLNTSLTLEEMNLFCSVLQAWSRQIAPIFYLNPSQYNITRLFNYLNKLPIQLYHFNFSSVFSNSAFLLYITVNLISSSPVWIINFCYQLKPNEKGKLAVKEDKGTGCCLWAGAQPSEQGSGGAHPSPSAQGWAHHRERQSPQVLLQSAELQGWPATRNSSVWPPKAKFRQWFEAHHARAQS